MIRIGNNFFFNFIYSHVITNIPNAIGIMLKNIRENPKDYSGFVNQNKALFNTIMKQIREINIPTEEIFQKVIAFSVEMGFITSLIELIRRCYDADISIRLYALAGITIFIVKCTGVVVRKLTPSDQFIKKVDDQGDITIESINRELQDLVNSRDDLPIPQLIDKLQFLSNYYTEEDTGPTTEATSRSFNLASRNLCDSIIHALAVADKTTHQGVKSVNIKNAKKMGNVLIKFTTGLNARLNAVRGGPTGPVGLGAELPRPPYVLGPAGPSGLSPPAPPGLGAAPPGLGAAPPPPAAAEEQPQQLGRIDEENGETKKMEEESKRSGGAAKRTTKKRSKKVKTKMLKGKSKKHLKKSKKDKKSKKGKKTGKKRVRFHSSSKKSKKNTRKRR